MSTLRTFPKNNVQWGPTKKVMTRSCLLEEVKPDLKRIYIDGCRCNERLNSETEGSRTSHIHWVARVNIQ